MSLKKCIPRGLRRYWHHWRNDMSRTAWIRCGIVLLAIGFIVLGVLRGEHSVMFQKAVNICLECIGIG